MSSLVPKCRQPVGQAFTQAGSRPTVARSTQSVHLAIFPVFAEKRGTLNGQPASHSRQPMHCSGFTSTMPFEYWTMAPGRRARPETARIGAVHALVLAHQPGEVAVDLGLLELDEVPELGVERGKGLVGPLDAGGHRRQVVPLLAGHLAGLAPDAGGGVDVLADGRHPAHPAGLAAERRRRLEDLETLDGHDGPQVVERGWPFSIRTRKHLYSGVQVFASPPWAS